MPKRGQPPSAMLWPDEQRGPWLIEAHWGVVAGRIECVRVEMRSGRKKDEEWAKPLPLLNEDDRREPVALTAEIWRAVPIAGVISTLRTRQRESNTRWAHGLAKKAQADSRIPEDLVADALHMLTLWDADTPEVTTRLEEVAAVYRRAWSNGDSPTKAVADHFVISPSAAAKRVARARAAGLLPPTSRGRASGAITKGAKHG